MRRLLTFDCQGETLGATLDEAGGGTGILMVMGGTQSRIGSHRMYERLAKSLSEHGHPCFRFDRRGVGESGGEDSGFEGSGPDITAAAAAFRAEAPTLRRLVGFGLCDGATALALHARAAGLDGVILVNPWLVEASGEAMAPAAVRAHYRERLLSREAWTKLLTGAIDPRKLLRGLRMAGSRTDTSLAGDAARGLASSGAAAALILTRGDATARAAAVEVERPAVRDLIAWRAEIDSDSHTFARPGDEEALASAVQSALEIIAPST